MTSRQAIERTATPRLRWAGSAAALAVLALAAASASAQMPFFPGAEGFGGTWAGAPPAGGWLSNATVYHVTNLNDSGPGSLRGAFVENSSNKIIVFDVGGTIQLTGGTLDIKNLSNYYIAGQTAPSPVTVYGNTTQVTASSNRTTSNVVLRYLSFRKGVGNGEDAVTFSGGNPATGNTNIIFDHLSASWAEDEILSVTNYNTNVTVQYTTIHDALLSDHAYGSLLRPRLDANVTFHHNLYENNSSRQARFGTYGAETLTADFRNNVVYNFRDRASYAGGSSEPEREFADVNYVGNYIIAGPGTTGNVNRAFGVDRNIDVRVYQSGNFIDSDKAANPGGLPNGTDRGWAAFGINSQGSPPQTLTQMPTPFATAPVATQSAADAYQQVLNYAGNFWWNRDLIDQRVINHVRTLQGLVLGADAPPATELSAVLSAPMTTRPAGWDSDADGMHDAWEVAHGLNPGSALDNKLDFDNDGYINVVEYLNEAGAFPAPTPIVFNGGTNNRFALFSNWKTDDGGGASGSHWQPSRFDAAVIHNGTAVVDAIGQQAGTVQVAPRAGDAATLEIGPLSQLDITQSLQIGAAGAGVVNHNGGIFGADEVIVGGAAGGSGTYNLKEGILRTGSLSLGAAGAFNFTGGVLTADDVNFDLIVQGGALSPGAPIGRTRIHGDLVIANQTGESPGGALVLDVGGPGLNQHDALFVDGTAMLGGALIINAVDLGGGVYTPKLGDAIPIVSAAKGAGGEFQTFDLPPLAPGLAWDFNPGAVTAGLYVVASTPFEADFNFDGAVDGTDLAILRTHLGYVGSPFRSYGDANADGEVDGADFIVWQQQVGSNAAVPPPPAAPIPEPAALALLACAAAALPRPRRRS